MKDFLKDVLQEKKILVLGFGIEGQSTFRYLREYFPRLNPAIADKDLNLFERTSQVAVPGETRLFLGDHYLDSLDEFDVIFKSPGIAIPDKIAPSLKNTLITSQTSLMLQVYHRNTIGITGTKGKSTTSSLIYHILQIAGKNSILVGNIGLPPFDQLGSVGPETRIVFELSSHQLEDIKVGPRIAVLLNLYAEHLDRYLNIEEYFGAKLNILERQLEGDSFIYNHDADGIPAIISRFQGKRTLIPFSTSFSGFDDGCYLSGDSICLSTGGKESLLLNLTDELYLKGRHNHMNMMAAALACRLAGVSDETIRTGIKSFHGLEHRLEYVGEFGGIHFYNDSIATIPEATIAAVHALGQVDTLILGGYDRMLDYSALVSQLRDSSVRNLIFMGNTGKRMLDMFLKNPPSTQHLFFIENLEEAFVIIRQNTEVGKICLLSPAAASYDAFKNFEDRGNLFKKLARGL